MMKKKYLKAVVAFCLTNCLVVTKAVPVSIVRAVENNSESPEVPAELIVDEDDSTTHNFERLVSAATCLVAGVEYTHGQQIYRKDQCEFCLCLDGEMFCWWQECPPVYDEPCKDRRPFSPCANGSDRPEIQTTRTKTSTTRMVSSSTQKPLETISSSELEETWITVDNETSSNEPVTESIYTNESPHLDDTTTGTTSTPVQTSCIVMGIQYKIGEKLPHDTGNCLECICGTGARITCSPHLCAPAGDDIVDYRPPGPRPELPDSF